MEIQEIIIMWLLIHWMVSDDGGPTEEGRVREFSFERNGIFLFNTEGKGSCSCSAAQRTCHDKLWIRSWPSPAPAPTKAAASWGVNKTTPIPRMVLMYLVVKASAENQPQFVEWNGSPSDK